MTDPIPIFESVPRERAEYVGDGCYACLVAETNTLWLETYNGVAVSERVALEPEAFVALVRFAARVGWRGADTSARGTCASCRHWAKSTGSSSYGECRRHAPVVLNRAPPILQKIHEFPVTYDSEWCGDYEEKRDEV